MTNSLVFADGVRLVTRDEIPGPAASRDADWSKVVAASIHPGYTLKVVHGEAFRYYAEANVHAHDIWPMFCDLARAVLDECGSLLLSFKDDEPSHVAEASIEAIIDALEPHRDQLAHDGYVHFGIVCESASGVTEVLVAPSKHFRVWFSDERAFASQMAAHGLARAERLEFVDEYPRVTTRLPAGRAIWADELTRLVVERLDAASRDQG